MPTESVAERAAAYGIPGIEVDGTDVLAVYRAMRAAVNRARQGDGPTLIDARVTRFTPHSSDDDDRVYRSPDEVDEARKRDPLLRFREYLLQQELLAAPRDREIIAEAQAIVDDAVAWAEQRPYPHPKQLAAHVFAETRR